MSILIKTSNFISRNYKNYLIKRINKLSSVVNKKYNKSNFTSNLIESTVQRLNNLSKDRAIYNMKFNINGPVPYMEIKEDYKYCVSREDFKNLTIFKWSGKTDDYSIKQLEDILAKLKDYNSLF